MKNDDTPPPDWLKRKRAKTDAELDKLLCNPEDADSGEGFDWLLMARWLVAGFGMGIGIIWWRLHP